MTTASFTVAYDGPALRDGLMDVRDLAPALLAVGQLFDAANAVLNRDEASVSVNVKATGQGSFEIDFTIVQSIASQLTSFFSGNEITAAINLKEIIFGGGASLIWLIKILRGKSPEKVEKLSESTVKIIFEGQTFEVPMALLRLYQDLAVRAAAQKAVAEPLKKNGIDVFEVRNAEKAKEISVSKFEVEYFTKPEIPDEILVDATKRAAFSIVSLSFKEDNKWRLYDGNTQISATVEDFDFQQRVDASQISFSKGDILLCDVRVKQKQTSHGLSTEYVVEKVIEHRPALRQLPLDFDSDAKDP